MEKNYRSYHSSQMHSNGTTLVETFLAVAATYTYSFIGITLTSMFLSYVTNRKKWQFLFEFFIFVVPIIIHYTVLSKYMTELFVSTVVIIISLIIIINCFKKSKKSMNLPTAHKHFITNCRAAVNLTSILAILAVDFKVFPRYLAKTETFGYSLMDVGVGMYMVANGIVAPELRGKCDSVKTSLKGSIPLFLLGGARFLLVKEADYNVPVSEYGVHWNFFITLALTKIFTSLIMNVIKLPYICINATVLLIAHETLLQAGLGKFVLSNSRRDTFIAANKEGIVSIQGYVSIYLFSVYFGYLLNMQKLAEHKMKTAVKIFGISVVFLVLTLTTEYFFGISRRLANSTFCFWILFVGTSTLGLYLVSEIIQETLFQEKLSNCIYTTFIVEAINYNGLSFFLLGNILTGLVNMTFNTLQLDDVVSIVILISYMFINCLVACILFHKQIKLKL